MKSLRSMLLLVVAFSLSSCATNVLRIEYAESLAAKGKAAAAASSAFLGEVEEARISANLQLVERDPYCRPNIVNIRLSPDLSRSTKSDKAAAGWLCSLAASEQTVKLSLAPLGPELEPTFQLIAALGAYSDSISKILEGETVDPAEEFAETIALLRAAEGTICALSGGTAVSGAEEGDSRCSRGSGTDPSIPNADDPRLTAVGSLLSFLGELATEQSQVDQLRQLAKANPGSAVLSQSLQEHLRDWDLSRRSDIVLLTTIENSLMAQRLNSNPPPAAAQRRQLVSQFYKREQEARSSLRAFAAMDAMLTDLVSADQNLRRVLRENPDLTQEEKARIARIYRARITRAFDSVTALITAF